MNAEQLADYLINNDYEIQIARRDYDTIAYRVDYDEIETDLETIKAAVEIAREDPIIRDFYLT